MDAVVLCRFPFLAETGAFVRRYGPPLDALLNSPDYEEVRHHGFLEVMAALGGPEPPAIEVVDEADALRSLLRYIVARIIVSHVAERTLVHRFALHEAARMRERLDAQGDDVLRTVAAELDLPIRVASIEGETRYAVHFGRYLGLAAEHIGGPGGEWKLINRPVAGGDVLLRRAEMTRLAMEAIARRIEADAPPQVDASMLGSMAGHLRTVREAVGRMRTADVKGPPDLDRSPPCVRHLLAEVSAGANLPHHARFTLVTYLNAIGMTSEDIVKAFAISPDFDDRIARYQVEHITGTHSGTEYSVPKCATLRTYGLCRDMDILCGEIVHPVQYYRARKARNDFEAASRVHLALSGRPVTGPRPAAGSGAVPRVNDKAVGTWFEGDLTVRDVRGRRVRVGDAWYTAAVPRFSDPDGPVEALPVLDWSLALELDGRKGRVARVRGFVTSSADGPLLHIVKVLG